MANATTQELIHRAETQIRSLGNAPAKVAQKVATDLERTVKSLEAILQIAWDYCGRHPDNDEAFNRYKGVLDAYTGGCAALDEYRGRRSAYGNEP